MWPTASSFLWTISETRSIRWVPRSCQSSFSDIRCRYFQLSVAPFLRKDNLKTFQIDPLLIVCYRCGDIRSRIRPFESCVGFWLVGSVFGILRRLIVRKFSKHTNNYSWPIIARIKSFTELHVIRIWKPFKCFFKIDFLSLIFIIIVIWWIVNVFFVAPISIQGIAETKFIASSVYFKQICFIIQAHNNNITSRIEISLILAPFPSNSQTWRKISMISATQLYCLRRKFNRDFKWTKWIFSATSDMSPLKVSIFLRNRDIHRCAMHTPFPYFY